MLGTHGQVKWLPVLHLIEINQELSKPDFVAKQSVLTELVDRLIDSKLVVVNPVTEKIFQNLNESHTVSDMAAASDLSLRQLQRTLNRTAGFAPQ